MASSYRGKAGRPRAHRGARWGLAIPLLLLGAAVLAGSGEPSGDTDKEFVGFITDTECGPNHAPMIAKGEMGKDDRECTLKCVSKGATFGFVDADRKRFYQLDDQDAPASYAGLKVRIRGRLQGDTIFVKSVAAAEDR